MSTPEFRRLFAQRMAEMFGREPRWRYFQTAGGPMFFWTVERYEDDADHEHAGLYISGAYAPVGKGSRSGKATRFELAADSVSGHRLRKDAKARALKLYRAHKAGERTPWR